MKNKMVAGKPAKKNSLAKSIIKKASGKATTAKVCGSASKAYKM